MARARSGILVFQMEPSAAASPLRREAVFFPFFPFFLPPAALAAR